MAQLEKRKDKVIEVDRGPYRAFLEVPQDEIMTVADLILALSEVHDKTKHIYMPGYSSPRPAVEIEECKSAVIIH